MEDFSIDATRERIHEPRTRRYFSEVYSSYANGNYRSAVVMLWSVVVCDLLFKLESLTTIYSDPAAHAILNEIDMLRRRNPRSPDWEWALVERIEERTQLLDAADVVNLQALREHRHLSAHPVLTASEVLYAPSKEQCRAHLRNALDGVLTKPAIMSRKVFDSLLEDIEEKQMFLPDDDSLRRYLDAKYWRNLSSSADLSIMRSLWRVIFRVNDARCEANRRINYRTFRLSYARRSNEFNSILQADPQYFSELSFTGSAAACLFDFLSAYPKVFGFLTEAATTPIRNLVNTCFDVFVTAWYLTGDVATHLAAVRKRIENGEHVTTGEAFESMFVVAKADGNALAACEIGILLYGRSGSYDLADHRFKHFIQPYLDEYDASLMRLLLDAIERNGQTHDRRQAKVDHQRVKRRADQLLASGWDSNYSEFRRSLS